MPLTIRTTAMKYKNSEGDYVGINAVADKTTAEQIADIEAAGALQENAIESKGAETIASIPQDYTSLSNTVNELTDDIILWTDHSSNNRHASHIPIAISAGDTVNVHVDYEGGGRVGIYLSVGTSSYPQSTSIGEPGTVSFVASQDYIEVVLWFNNEPSSMCARVWKSGSATASEKIVDTANINNNDFYSEQLSAVSQSSPKMIQVPFHVSKGDALCVCVDNVIAEEYVSHQIAFGNSPSTFVMPTSVQYKGAKRIIAPGTYNYIYVYVNCTSLTSARVSVSRKKFNFATYSVLGDSYSAYEGTIPSGNTKSYPYSGNDVDDPSQMWWRVIGDQNEATLDLNESWSGAPVCNYAYNTSQVEKSFVTRVKNVPASDVIFVFGGTNDDWGDSELGDYVYSGWTTEQLNQFRPALSYVLNWLLVNRPTSKIIVILNDVLASDYKDSMLAITAHYNIDTVELTGINKISSHPTKAGMMEIGGQIARKLMMLTETSGEYDGQLTAVGEAVEELTEDVADLQTITEHMPPYSIRAFGDYSTSVGAYSISYSGQFKLVDAHGKEIARMNESMSFACPFPSTSSGRPICRICWDTNETTIPLKIVENMNDHSPNLYDIGYYNSDKDYFLGIVSDASIKAKDSVRYNTAQNLTSAQKTQARTNIDAADAEEVGDLKSAIFESVTANIPCSIVPAPDTATLALTNYSGKKVFVSNRNLLPQFPEVTDHGITCTQNADGSISLSGTANGSASFRLSLNVMPNLTKGTYKLIAGNGSTTIGDDVTYINASINDSWSGDVSARLDQSNSSCVFTLSENDVLDGMRIRISSGVVIPSGYTIYPMIVEYGQDETFVAHAGTVLSPSESENDITVYPDYTYICAQSGVTGTVTYKKSEIDGLNDDIANLDARVTVLEQKASKLAGKKIVCFGDSITGNYQPPADYPSMIAEITGATVYNMGFGGCCMAEVSTETRKMFSMAALADAINSGDYSAQVNSGVSITYGGTSIDYVPIRLEVLTNMDWSTVDYITIAYGTNDWNSNFLPENENDPFDKTKYIGAFRYSVEKILSKYPNIKILVITPLWRFWDSNTGMPGGISGDYIDSNDYAKGTGYKLWQYGDALVEAAHDMQIPVFDIYHACMMNKYNRHQYFNTNDGTHPKYAGIQMIAEMITAHMESVY